MKKKLRFTFPSGVYFELARITPRDFYMGIPEAEETFVEMYSLPKIFCKLRQSYFMAVFPTSIKQWRERDQGKGKEPSSTQDAPITSVTWQESIEYCEFLNDVFAVQIPDGYKFSLPFEHQWEFACTNGKFLQMPEKYKQYKPLLNMEYYRAIPRPKPFVQKNAKANELGCYQMLGNVGEWTFNPAMYYDEYFDLDNPLVDLYSVAGAFEKHKIVRGGLEIAWYREFLPGCLKDPKIGFRVALRKITKIDKEGYSFT